jgi:hypothetical protein
VKQQVKTLPTENVKVTVDDSNTTVAITGKTDEVKKLALQVRIDLS